MNIIKSIIIEDTPANLNTLKTFLTEECPYVKVLGDADNLEDGEALIKQTQPQLVFLDIEIKRATSFELLEKLHKIEAINFEIIFFTAYGTYENATRAIEFSALDFLTKPLNREKLKIAVEKATKKLNQIQTSRQIELLLETLRLPNFKSKKIAFHLTKGIIEFINVDNILYLEADKTITHIYLQDGSKLNALRNIGHYSKLLTFDYNFFPISNSLLVNLDYIKQYIHSELRVILVTGKELYASRRGGQDFRRFLNNNKGKYRNIQGDTWKGKVRKFFGG